MVATDWVMVTEVRLEQPENASFPMLVTELGMITVLRLLHHPKVNGLIVVMELGIVRFSIKLSFRYKLP